MNESYESVTQLERIGFVDLEKLRAEQIAAQIDSPFEKQLRKLVDDVKEKNRFLGEIRGLKQLNDPMTARLIDLARMKATFQPPDWLEEIQKKAITLRVEFEKTAKLLADSTQPFKSAASQFDVWDQGITRALSEVARHSELFQTLQVGSTYLAEFQSIAKSISAHRIDINFPSLTNRLLAPSAYFTEYVRNTAQRISTLENDNDETILEGALSFAEAEYIESTSLNESLLAADITIVEPSPPVIYNLFEAQEQELFHLVGKDGVTRIENMPSIFNSMRTTEIAQMTRELLTLIVTCNQESRTRGGEDIFKLTNAMLEAAADLPMLIVKNKDSLAAFIRHLYRMIYEGAGSDKLRLLSENGGCLERSECDAIWNLKMLRNKLTDHDPEHGSQGDIKKSYTALGEALRKLGRPGLPVTETDYLALQKTLLSQLKDVLTNLLTKIST
jgi:hypothetical protein